MSHYLDITAEVVTKFSPSIENTLLFLINGGTAILCCTKSYRTVWTEAQPEEISSLKNVLKEELYMETDMDLILLLDPIIKYFISLSGMEGRCIFNWHSA